MNASQVAKRLAALGYPGDSGKTASAIAAGGNKVSADVLKSFVLGASRGAGAPPTRKTIEMRYDTAAQHELARPLARGDNPASPSPRRSPHKGSSQRSHSAPNARKNTCRNRPEWDEGSLDVCLQNSCRRQYDRHYFSIADRDETVIDEQMIPQKFRGNSAKWNFSTVAPSTPLNWKNGLRDTDQLAANRPEWDKHIDHTAEANLDHSWSTKSYFTDLSERPAAEGLKRRRQLAQERRRSSSAPRGWHTSR